MHPDFRSYPLGSAIIRMNDRYEFGGFGVVLGETAACSRCFRCETLALQVRPHVVPNFKFSCPVYHLPGQATVTDEFSIVGFDNP